jgi:hypothetical protein
MADDRWFMVPPPFRRFCICAIYPSGTGCMRRPRPRAPRRQRGGHGGRAGSRDDGGGDDGGGGDGPPPRSGSRRSAGRRS